jgi:GT2 family glycosyltransferase
MKRVSIIIISYNRPDDTLDLLKDITQLDNISLLANVIVLNNLSTTDYSSVTSFIKSQHSFPFLFITAPENLGVSRGRNYATKFAEGEILFFLDDDVNLKDTGTLIKLIKAFEQNEINNRKLGVVSFKVLYSSNMEMQKNALPHKKFEKYKDLHHFLTYYYAGCAHAKLNLAWIDAGPYPENFFYGMEEYDFSYRVLNKGYYIQYDDSITVLHKESPLGRKTKAEKLRMMWVNKSKVAWRYLPKKYFYSTVIMWCFQYLIKSGLNMHHFVKAIKEIFKIPATEKRNLLSENTLDYLKRVEARLWF